MPLKNSKYWLRVDPACHQILEVANHATAVEESPANFGLDLKELCTLASFFPNVDERRRVIFETAIESGWVAIYLICRCRVGYFSFSFFSNTMPEVRLLKAIQSFGRRHGFQHTDVIVTRNTASCMPEYKRWLFGDVCVLSTNPTESINHDIDGGK